MEITIKHYGASRSTPAKFIELIFKDNNTSITVDVTNSKGLVDKDLIENLRDISDELEEQNKQIEASLIE